MKCSHLALAKLDLEQAQRFGSSAPAPCLWIDPELGEKAVSTTELEVEAVRDDRVADVHALALDQPDLSQVRVVEQTPCRRREPLLVDLDVLDHVEHARPAD